MKSKTESGSDFLDFRQRLNRAKSLPALAGFLGKKAVSMSSSSARLRFVFLQKWNRFSS